VSLALVVGGAFERQRESRPVLLAPFPSTFLQPGRAAALLANPFFVLVVVVVALGPRLSCTPLPSSYLVVHTFPALSPSLSSFLLFCTRPS